MQYDKINLLVDDLMKLHNKTNDMIQDKICVDECTLTYAVNLMFNSPNINKLYLEKYKHTYKFCKKKLKNKISNLLYNII
jgi:hypothetical protein